MKGKNVHKVFLLVWPIVATVIGFSFEGNFLANIVLFLGIPAIYLAIVARDVALRAVLFSGFFTFGVAIVFDYILHGLNGWAVANAISGFRIFTYVVPEQLVWAFFYFLTIVLIYEYWFAKHRHVYIMPQVPARFGFLITGVFATFIGFYVTAPELLLIDQFYFKGGLVVVLIPLALVLLKSPHIWKKFLPVVLYMFYISAWYQFAALGNGWWSYPEPSQYIFFVHMFGHAFPVEEILIWMIGGPISALATYEYFYDRVPGRDFKVSKKSSR